MPIYKDTNYDSGVSTYEIYPTSITVCFKGTSRSYTYSYSVAGQTHVENMKSLAESGNGLNAYINNNVKFKYDR
jgi:hypothetical protein